MDSQTLHKFRDAKPSSPQRTLFFSNDPIESSLEGNKDDVRLQNTLDTTKPFEQASSRLGKKKLARSSLSSRQSIIKLLSITSQIKSHASMILDGDNVSSRSILPRKSSRSIRHVSSRSLTGRRSAKLQIKKHLMLVNRVQNMISGFHSAKKLIHVDSWKSIADQVQQEIVTKGDNLVHANFSTLLLTRIKNTMHCFARSMYLIHICNIGKLRRNRSSRKSPEGPRSRTRRY